MEPDDPRIRELAEDLRRARDDTSPFLLWSGEVSPGDEADAVNILFCKRWWLFTATADLDEIDEQWAVELLTWLFGHTLAYDVKLMPDAQAADFASRFLELLPARRRWFTNGSDRWTGWEPRPNPFDPLTDYTFDTGLVVVADRRAWVAWFTDED